jgi:hypothetical protein
MSELRPHELAMFMDFVAENIKTPDDDLDAWPNCAVPDCENKACRWAGTARCHPCSVRLVGEAEMDRRYFATRMSATDRSWNGKVADV